MKPYELPWIYDEIGCAITSFQNSIPQLHLDTSDIGRLISLKCGCPRMMHNLVIHWYSILCAILETNNM